MWNIQDAATNTTNKVAIPKDGLITISNPDSVRVNAYINDAEAPTHQVAVKAGDTVYFKLTNYREGETPIGIMYDDVTNVIMLPGKLPDTTVLVSKEATDEVMGALNKQADEARKYYDKLAKQIKQVAENAKLSTLSTGDINMAEIMTPGMIMGQGGGDGGMFGGGGLIGGLILGSLLRNNGNLLGGDGAGGAALGATLRNPPEQNQANMDLMAAIGAVDKSVAISTATMEASQATQTLGITTQLNSVASSLAGRVDNLKDVVNTNAVALMQGQAAINQNIMENRYELSRDISNDGEKTRALITSQYEINLQRQLADANAQIIELRGNNNLQGAAAGITLTNTNNINQMQQQSQQQAQYNQLAHLIYGLGQNITNGAINVGSGTLTANPTNTNTSIR